MELDNLKTAWQEYDRKLEKNLKLNEALLRQMKLNQSQKELKTPLFNEYVTLITSILVIMYSFIIGLRFYTAPQFLFTSLFIFGMYIFFLSQSIRKIKILSGIDYYNSSILELQKAILQFETIYRKNKKIELVTSPMIIVSLLIIFMKGFHGANILEEPSILCILSIISLVLATLLVLWIYKYGYDKKVKRVHQFLNQIKEFEEKTE